jgi:hypothetical protein
MILGGDLNLTTSRKEVWGAHVRTHPSQLYFNQLFQVEELVDVEPLKVLPIWRNGRIGHNYIAKRLDRFFISEDLAMS